MLLIDMGCELKKRPIKINDSPLVNFFFMIIVKYYIKFLISLFQASHENQANIDSPRKNGRQIAPGVLLVSPETSTSNKPNQGNDGVPLVSVASNMANDISVTNIQPTKQLAYFSEMLGFKVQYSDFPKVCNFLYFTCCLWCPML